MAQQMWIFRQECTEFINVSEPLLFDVFFSSGVDVFYMQFTYYFTSGTLIMFNIAVELFIKNCLVLYCFVVVVLLLVEVLCRLVIA